MIPFTQTIFLWQSLVSVAVESAVVTLVMWLAAPPAGRTKTARDLGVDLTEPEPVVVSRRDVPPGAWLEHSMILPLFVVAIGTAYLVRYFMRAPQALNAINLGVLLHRTPARLMIAVQGATPAVWGVLLQFPFYAGIAAIITGTHLSQKLAAVFVGISTTTTFPAIVALYSAVLGVFVPSGGSKWVIEAPYVMAAAHSLKVHLGWAVVAYDLGEALANLLQPFWMLPILGMLGLRARDVMGFTFVVALVLTPVVLILVTLLGLTLGYPL
jgi:short-chain fatty acids transporter